MSTIDYEIRLAGNVPTDTLADLLDGHPYLILQGVETVLRGPVPDQAALIGIINWLQFLGVELREVRQAGPDKPVSHDQTDRAARFDSADPPRGE